MFSGLINQSNAQSVSSTVEIPFAVYVPCANDGAGETVSGILQIHFLNHIDKDGNLTKWHAQPQAQRVVGETTGMVYRGGGVTQEMLDFNPGASTYSSINRFHFVGKGIQFFVKDTFHMTTNANGETTADVSNSSVECK